MESHKISLFLCFFDGRLLMKAVKLGSYYRGSLFYLISLVAFMASWYFEYTTGASIASTYYSALKCPIFLQAPVISELIGVLGFSVGLIALVYSFWDKRILGLRYRDLVKYKFHSYHICAVAHVISIACCIMSASAKTSESALISLAAVVYGFVYQSLVVYWTVWDSRKCANTAMQKYGELIKTTLDKQNSVHNKELYKHLRKLSDTMPQPADRQYNAQMECFARTLVAYVVSENKCGSANEQVLLSQITDIWTSVFHAPGPYDIPKESIFFAADVFSYLASIGMDHDTNEKRFCANYSQYEMAWAWNQICCGYIICRVNELRMNASEEDAHNKLYREIAKILSVLPEEKLMIYIKDALTSLLVVLMLSSFTAHAIPYNPQVIEMYKKYKLNKMTSGNMVNAEYIEIWRKRKLYWDTLCEHLQFSITIRPNVSKNILKYAQKI